MENLFFKIHRDCDTWRLRKVVIECHGEDGELIDRRRMFSFPLFNLDKRVARKIKRMTRCAEKMWAGLDAE